MVWVTEQAERVVRRLKELDKTVPVFQTGYGPSGSPHIGTFGEVARTTWVRNEYERITEGSSCLITFSDDMDALRRIPDGIPNGEMLEAYLGLPLTHVPNPYSPPRPCPRCSNHIEQLVALGYSRDCSLCGGKGMLHDGSFAQRNNQLLRAFLDEFNLPHTFMSATTTYNNGAFDHALGVMLAKHDEIRDIILPTLGPDRRATYSPFMPIHPETGHVMQVAIEETFPLDGMITWRDPETGILRNTSVYGGRAKAQWKADWALRWFALGVDYEMHGKDLIDSVVLSTRICKALGGVPPITMTYELFLDHEGKKISKSKGNGLTIWDWLSYAPQVSLQYFMFQNPQRAKKLFLDLIPKITDEWIVSHNKFAAGETLPEDNPLRFIGGYQDPHQNPIPVTYALLLNLINVSGATDNAIVWSFLHNYRSDITVENHPLVDELITGAIKFYEDKIKPTVNPRQPTDQERPAFDELLAYLQGLMVENPNAPSDVIQTEVYEIGKRNGFKDNLRQWFACLYEVMIGQSEGPRFGQFVALYGIQATAARLELILNK